MIFFLNMCILIGKSLAVFQNCCLSLHIFWLKMQKIAFSEEKRVLSIVSIKLKYRRLQTGLADLKKHQTFVFFLWVDFLCIFENITFFRFLKIISSTC